MFQYIQIIKSSGIEEWIFRECQKMAELSFRFKEKSSDAADYTSYTASNMHDYPVEYCIAGPYVQEQYDPVVIHEFLQLLNPQNFGYDPQNE